jgi:hypothetical protein
MSCRKDDQVEFQQTSIWTMLRRFPVQRSFVDVILRFGSGTSTSSFLLQKWPLGAKISRYQHVQTHRFPIIEVLD